MSSRRKPEPPKRQHPLVILLRRYAAAFIVFEGPLLSAAKAIDRISTTDDRVGRALVIDAIDNRGCNALIDLVEQTQLDRAQVARLYLELIEDGEFESRPIGYKRTEGSGQRRPKGIFRKSEPAGDVYSAHHGRSNYHNADADDDDD